MKIVDIGLRKTFVAWVADGTANEFGDYKVSSTPQEFRGRWKRGDRYSKLETVDSEDYPDPVLTTQATIPINSLIYLGKLSEITGETNTTTVALLRVVTVKEVPGLKTGTTFRQLYLARVNTKIPQG